MEYISHISYQYPEHILRQTPSRIVAPCKRLLITCAFPSTLRLLTLCNIPLRILPGNGDSGSIR